MSNSLFYFSSLLWPWFGFAIVFFAFHHLIYCIINRKTNNPKRCYQNFEKIFKKCSYYLLKNVSLSIRFMVFSGFGKNGSVPTARSGKYSPVPTGSGKYSPVPTGSGKYSPFPPDQENIPPFPPDPDRQPWLIILKRGNHFSIIELKALCFFFQNIFSLKWCTHRVQSSIERYLKGGWLSLTRELCALHRAEGLNGWVRCRGYMSDSLLKT